MTAQAALAADTEPHMKTKVCNPGETLCADVITSAGQSRLTVDSSPAANVVSTANSSTATLGGGATFTGAFEEIVLYADVTVLIKASHTGTLVVEWSNDGSNIVDSDTYLLAANTGKQFSFGAMARYVRVKYTNDATPQSSFAMQTIYKRVRGKPSSHRLADAVVDNDDAELVKAALTGRDANGVWHNIQTDLDGNFVITALTGFGADFTFGDVASSDTTTKIVRRTAYTEQTTNAQRSFSSTDVDDDGSPVDTGARTLKLTYYTSAGVGPLTETLTLNGTTCVATVASDIAYVEEIEVLTVGATGSNEGTISLFVNAACGGGTIGTIAVNNNQTFWAHHYVPTGKTANVTGISTGSNSTTVGCGALFVLKSKLLLVADAAEDQVSDFVRLYGQSSTFARAYVSPIKVTGPARLLLYVTPECSSAITYRAAIDFFEP